MRFAMSSSVFLASAVLAVAGTFVSGNAVQAQQWGTVKGQVVWAGGAIPANPPLNVDKDKAVCLKEGPLLANKLVITPKSKGVRWVLVWLADPKDARNVKFVPPIHPSLKNSKPTVEIDQPCCVFEPRVMGLWADKQTVVVKNPASIPHNFAITSIGEGPSTNPLIPPGGQVTVKGFVPKLVPTTYSCSIHTWMKGWIGSFAHPYFAVTDKDGNFEIKNAPAGKFQVVAWQEEVGFVMMKDKMIRGKLITIKANGVTDLGKIDMKPSAD